MQQKIQTSQAPKAIGPYSQAIKTDSLIFVSGQVAMDPETSELISGGITEQTKQVFENLSAILKSAGSDFSKVVKVSVFMTDLAEFAQMNAVYAEYLQETLPARETVQVAALPKAAIVEISLIAQT